MPFWNKNNLLLTPTFWSYFSLSLYVKDYKAIPIWCVIFKFTDIFLHPLIFLMLIVTSDHKIAQEVYIYVPVSPLDFKTGNRMSFIKTRAFKEN